MTFFIIGLMPVFWCDCEKDQSLGEACLSLSGSIAQTPGSDSGHADYETYADLKIPPLHPEQALERFQLEDDFRIELVAHEPMVIDPIAMDNWIYSTCFPSLRRVDGRWQTQPFEGLGRWGLVKDNWERLYSTHNSWPLLTHQVPHGNNEHHPGFEMSAGQNVRIAPNEPLCPAHATGVNRGYRVGVVTREDGTLRQATGRGNMSIGTGNSTKPPGRPARERCLKTGIWEQSISVRFCRSLRKPELKSVHIMYRL